MASQDYTYATPTAFVGLAEGKVPEPSQLMDAVQRSAITVALDVDPGAGVSATQTDITFRFRSPLTSPEVIELDQLVAAHDGLGLPDPKNPARVPYVVLNGEDNQVQLVGRKGSDTVSASHDFADPTTWYQGSTRTTDTLTDSGDGLTFDGHHQFWVDLTHGLMLYERDIVANDLAAAGHGWHVEVRVDAVPMTPRAPFAVTGGDYSVDYAAGTVTFFASQAGKVVVSDYSYVVPGAAGASTWELLPTAGKLLEVLDSEAQFSLDAQFQGAIVYGIHGAVEVFAPALAVSNGGPVPDGTPIPLVEKYYDTTRQLIADARGSYPVVPAMPGPRGHSQQVVGFPFYYGTVNQLLSSAGMKLVVRMENDHPVTGEYTTVTLYCLSLDET